MSQTSGSKPNSLINEASPYLLQHAYNPVEWVAYSDDAFKKAQEEDKIVLVSIGYSACHWCHVMERESFMDESVAKLMNDNFVNIKVDREERSDVDMMYMQAVQMMSGHGGWPLNCFVLPDGRPFYGGTYFTKDQWKQVLTNLPALYKNEREKVLSYAEAVADGISKAEALSFSNETETVIDRDALKATVGKWKGSLDNREGGPDHAPKFPLPNNYQFLLRYALLEKDSGLLDHVRLTLRKMAFGGLHDHVHGGFARYSTDMQWKVPHFEKMLYDNAQLASLYTEAFTHTGDAHFEATARKTLDFAAAEWLDEAGSFYSAYDADSEGVEGKFYVWTKEELGAILGDDLALFSDCYGINERGYWEDDNYILMRAENTAQILSTHHITAGELETRMNAALGKLKAAAALRVKPGCDDKSVTSWNAMMCTAYVRGFLAFGDERYKAIALKVISHIMKTMYDGTKLLRIYRKGEKKISGFLDDYAFTIEALMQCYLLEGEERFLDSARQMCHDVLERFSHAGSDYLYYTEHETGRNLVRNTETVDNVIPGSNSQMALNMFALADYYDVPAWRFRAERMLAGKVQDLKEYGSGFSNWGCLALQMAFPFREVCIVGKNVEEMFHDLYRHGVLNAIFALAKGPSALPLLEDKVVEQETKVYVCENRACRLPADSVEQALSELA